MPDKDVKRSLSPPPQHQGKRDADVFAVRKNHIVIAASGKPQRREGRIPPHPSRQPHNRWAGLGLQRSVIQNVRAQFLLQREIVHLRMFVRSDRFGQAAFRHARNEHQRLRFWF